MTWYPGGGGILLRAGAGVGYAWAEVETEYEGSYVTRGVVSHAEYGLATVLGVGYEWRLTRRFALGPAIDYIGIDLGDGRKTAVVNVTLGATWYL